MSVFFRLEALEPRELPASFGTTVPDGLVVGPRPTLTAARIAAPLDANVKVGAGFGDVRVGPRPEDPTTAPAPTAPAPSAPELPVTRPAAPIASLPLAPQPRQLQPAPTTPPPKPTTAPVPIESGRFVWSYLR